MGGGGIGGGGGGGGDSIWVGWGTPFCGVSGLIVCFGCCGE
jgi:hypothetical protein